LYKYHLNRKRHLEKKTDTHKLHSEILTDDMKRCKQTYIDILYNICEDMFVNMYNILKYCRIDKENEQIINLQNPNKEII
jgi:Na+/phosphate symporter